MRIDIHISAGSIVHINPHGSQLSAEDLTCSTCQLNRAGLRTAPLAGARYPLEVYAATRDGLFRYLPAQHSLDRVLTHDPRPELYQAALQQDAVLEAPLVIVICAVFERTAQRYGDARTPQYVYLETGHAAQNILLQAVALELGAVPIGAFFDEQISQSFSLPPDETPVYLIPIGHPR